MRAVVQRVLNAGVTVDGECVGKIGRGYLVLLGVGHDDTRAEADKLWGKLRGLRINEDENGKTNLALADVDGEVLVVSQFTLFADCRHGRRPSFTDAGAPDVANELYERPGSCAGSARATGSIRRPGGSWARRAAAGREPRAAACTGPRDGARRQRAR